MEKTKVDEIIDGLLRLSQKIIPHDDWAMARAEPMMGKPAQLVVYDLGKTYSRCLKLGSNFEVLDAEGAEPYHQISMAYDTMIALLAGDLDWGQGWTEGKIEFSGQDYVKHAALWSKAFKRFKGYLGGK